MGQGVLFLQMSIIGIVIAVVFDVTRALRKVFKHHRFLVHIEDMLFWLLTGLGVLYFVLNHAGGEIRFFYLLGIFLGALLYWVSVSHLVIKFFHFLFRLVISLFKLIFKLISDFFHPFVVLGRKIMRRVTTFFLLLSKRIQEKMKKSFDKGKNYGKIKIASYQMKREEEKRKKQLEKESQDRAKEMQRIKQEKEKRLKALEEQMRRTRENNKR